MKKSFVDLSKCEEISRRTALLSVGTSKIVAKVKNRDKIDLYEISTMEDLQNAVNMEQKALYCEELTFYMEK